QLLPPRSTLCPYTTLFRSGKALLRIERHDFELVGIAKNSSGDTFAQINIQSLPLAFGIGGRKTGKASGGTAYNGTTLFDIIQCRSEEHRSELQSRENLVCR